MYYIHIVKRFRAHCGFYAIENKLLLLLLLKYTRCLFDLVQNAWVGLLFFITLQIYVVVVVMVNSKAIVIVVHFVSLIKNFVR